MALGGTPPSLFRMHFRFFGRQADYDIRYSKQPPGARFCGRDEQDDQRIVSMLGLSKPHLPSVVDLIHLSKSSAPLSMRSAGPSTAARTCCREFVVRVLRAGEFVASGCLAFYFFVRPGTEFVWIAQATSVRYGQAIECVDSENWEGLWLRRQSRTTGGNGGGGE